MLSASNQRQQKCHIIFDSELIKPAGETINNPFKETVKISKFDSKTNISFT